MKYLSEFENTFAVRLPDTNKLLIESNLAVDECITKITLHGSRGLAGNSRPDSDIDLTLVVDTDHFQRESDKGSFLNLVLSKSLQTWNGTIELDLALAFDKSGCGLSCFDVEYYNPGLCETTIDCMGLYKVQKGYNGFVSGSFLDASKMYPLIVIWRNPDTYAQHISGADG